MNYRGAFHTVEFKPQMDGSQTYFIKNFFISGWDEISSCKWMNYRGAFHTVEFKPQMDGSQTYFIKTFSSVDGMKFLLVNG